MALLSPCSPSGEPWPQSLRIGSPVSPALTPSPQSHVRFSQSSASVSPYSSFVSNRASQRSTSLQRRQDAEEKISVIDEHPSCSNTRQLSIDPDFHLPEVVTAKRMFDHEDDWDATTPRRPADLKASVPYTKTRRHLKGLQFRYVCRVPGCPDAYESPAQEKRHFKDVHVFAHACTICANRFQKPKQLWQHLSKKHRLNIPAEPKYLSDVLGCPCCSKTAIEQLAGDNLFSSKAASSLVFPRNLAAEELQSYAAPKSSPRSRIKILGSDLRRPHRQTSSRDSKQSSIHDNNIQDAALDTSRANSRHGEGYLEVTTDGSSFKVVHVNGIETPEALTKKIITAMGLGTHDFPSLITIRLWNPRVGPTKALYDAKDVWTAVHDAIDDTGSLKLYLSTFFSLAKRPEHEHLSEESTVVADSQGKVFRVGSCSDRSRLCQSDHPLQSGNPADAIRSSTTEQPSAARHDHQESGQSGQASPEVSMSAQDCRGVLQRHSTGSSRASTIKQQLSFKCSSILGRYRKNEDSVKKADYLSPADSPANNEKPQDPTGTYHEVQLADGTPVIKEIDSITPDACPDDPPIEGIKVCETARASVADSGPSELLHKLSPISQQVVRKAGFVPEWLETIPVPKNASRLDSGQGMSGTDRVAGGLPSIVERRTICDLKRTAPALNNGRSAMPGLKNRLRSAFSRGPVPALAPSDQSACSKSCESHRDVSDNASQPPGDLTDSAADPEAQEPVTSEGIQSHTPGATGQERSTPLSAQAQQGNNCVPNPIPPPFSAPRGRDLPSDGEDDDRRLNPKRPRLQTPSSGSYKLRFPCIYRVGEPDEYHDHKTRFQHISQLERHLRSHGFFACYKCCSLFTNEKQQADHLDKRKPGCFKACQNRSCRRFWPKTSGAAPTECDCIRTSEKQWEHLFRLRYPYESIANVFPTSTQQTLNPGLQQISPITPTSHSLPSPLEPDQFQDLPGKQTIAGGEVPQLQTHQMVPDLLQSMDDTFDIDAILGGNSHSSVDFSKSGSIATGSTSSWQEVQRLQEKNKELENRLNILTWKSSQPDPRSEKLEQVLGSVWQALVNTKNASADPFSPLWCSMKELAPDIVRKAMPGIAPVSDTAFANSSSNTLGSSNFSSLPSREISNKSSGHHADQTHLGMGIGTVNPQFLSTAVK